MNVAGEQPRTISDRKRVPIGLLAAVTILMSLVGLFWLLTFRQYLLTMEFRAFCALVTAYIITLVTVTVVSTPGKLWAPSSIYLAMLTLFHFGAVAAYAAGQSGGEAGAIAERWLLSAWAPEAILYAALGTAACCLGVSVATIGGYPKADRNVGLTATSKDISFIHYLSILGAAMVLIGVSAWFFFVIQSGGFALFFGSYSQYLEATAKTPMGYVWVLLGFGLAFVSASGEQHHRLSACTYLFFGLFALFALPLGLRGEVLFTSLGALVVRARRGKQPSIRLTVTGVIIVLVLISAIRELRQDGLNAADGIVMSGSATEGIVELGSTLRPMVEVLDWQTGGDDGLRGGTYWAPIDRLLCRFFTPVNCTAAADDERLMNVVVADRAGPIGFSPIAEAYENFRGPGVILVMVIIGLLVGFMNKWSSTPLMNAVTGLLMVELLINVRNAFTAVPSHLLLGFSCILVAWCLASLFPFQSSRRAAHSTMLPEQSGGIHG